MKEIFDTIAFVGLIVVLFVLLAGFNRQQVQKHNERLEEIEKRQKKNKEQNEDG
jgi:uncharacterized membrane protein